MIAPHRLQAAEQGKELLAPGPRRIDTANMRDACGLQKLKLPSW